MILNKKEVVNDTYEVKFFIGEGAFGEVYRVNHKFLGTQVLKVLKEKYVDNSNIEDILKEAQILSSLTHENIVRVFESNKFNKDAKEYYFISMGFVSGESLSDLLKREISIPFKTAIKIQIDLLKALQAAQKKNIVHRDINTDNVLLSYSSDPPTALLSDFGLALTMDLYEKLPDVAGRYAYFAPECFYDTYLPTSDVFSAGIIFYRMLTSAFPWEYDFDRDSSFDEIGTEIIKSRKKKPTKPSFFNPDISVFIDDVCLRALKLDIEKRYKNALEFLEDLQDALNSIDVDYSSASEDEKSVQDQQESEEIASKTEEKEWSYKVAKKGNGFDKIAGMDELKETLYTDVIQALKEKELYEEYGISIPNGLLLYGPPGCGKTYISRMLAEEVDFNFIEIKPSDLASIYVSGRQQKIGELFDQAREEAPTIIFIDEVDALFPNRESSAASQVASDVNEFLAQMTECGKQGIFIIAATNRPEKIDPAIMRTGRMDKVVYLPPPDSKARFEMFQKLLKKRPTENIDLDNLSKSTENYVSSDINFFVDEASRVALKERSKIKTAHVLEAIKKYPPSISISEIERYEKFKDQRNFV